MKLFHVLFCLGLALILIPLGQIYWLTTTVESTPSDPRAAVLRASEGLISYSYPPPEDVAVLQREAEAGNALAQNNLAILYSRMGRPGDNDRATALFEAAAAQGLVQARYNLALRIAHEFDSAPEDIRRQIDLLEQNIAAGDVHSNALLASRLYFDSRDDYVSDRIGYRQKLRQQAAESGDRDYIYQYGHQLWEDHRKGHPADLEVAVIALLQAHDMGEARAAHRLGDMLAHRDRDLVIPHLVERGRSTDLLIWYDRGAKGGLRASACEYGRHVFPKPLRSGPENDQKGSASAWLAEMISDHPDEVIEQAVTHLTDCMMERERRLGPIPVFGEDALYLRKLRGFWPGTLGWHSHAQLMLGIWAGFGPRPDRARALELLLPLADDGSPLVGEAGNWIELLDADAGQ